LDNACSNALLQDGPGAECLVQKPFLQVPLGWEAREDEQPASVVGQVYPVVPVGQVQKCLRFRCEQGHVLLDGVSIQADVSSREDPRGDQVVGHVTGRGYEGGASVPGDGLG
jgi:hypothetical protein